MVPVVDISALDGGHDDLADRAVVDAVASAAETFGFFQIVGHGVCDKLIDDVWKQTRSFFAMDRADKLAVSRTKENARGFYDSELTKQARDLKEVFDFAHVPHPELVAPLGDMALHHHTDAGAFTLLLQDDIGGLQVEHRDIWLDVEPIDGALVVNTGDIMQVWSNDRYRAARHRVHPMMGVERYSLPYFFNPSYATDYAPVTATDRDPSKYTAINWGEFRQARAAGDYADYGEEIQISQFRT